MPLHIIANRGIAPVPQIVAPQIVVQQARQGGNPDPLAVGYTYPTVNIDGSGLSFRERRGPSGPEFSFDTGTLELKLRQEMWISNALSNCAQQKWIVHENGHVVDNQAVMNRMDAAIRTDHTLKRIFIQQHWIPRARFQATQQTIRNAVAAIFKRLTGDAAKARDTLTEYMRVERDILLNCPETYIHEVTSGETLSQLAEYFYGRLTAWQTIYRANQAVIGGNPNLIRVGQRLVIPRTP